MYVEWLNSQIVKSQKQWTARACIPLTGLSLESQKTKQRRGKPKTIQPQTYADLRRQKRFKRILEARILLKGKQTKKRPI